MMSLMSCHKLPLSSPLQSLRSTQDVEIKNKLRRTQTSSLRWQYLQPAFPLKTGRLWSPLHSLDVIIGFSVSRVLPLYKNELPTATIFLEAVLHLPSQAFALI